MEKVPKRVDDIRYVHTYMHTYIHTWLRCHGKGAQTCGGHQFQGALEHKPGGNLLKACSQPVHLRMCVCVCVCVYIYIYIYIQAWWGSSQGLFSASSPAYMCVCTYTYIRICMYVCICAYIYIYIYIYTHIYL